VDSIAAEDAAKSGGGETFHHSVLWLRADGVTEQGHYCRRELHYDGGVLAMPDTELIAAFGQHALALIVAGHILRRMVHLGWTEGRKQSIGICEELILNLPSHLPEWQI